jgi:heme/copper-type cytochrome/quinol oxidase subunit 2
MTSSDRLQITKSRTIILNISNADVLHDFVICIMLVCQYVESKVNTPTRKHVNAMSELDVYATNSHRGSCLIY